MELVHLGHSCVVLDTGAGRILFDPGTFSSGWETLEGLDAVVVTHQHPDHVDVTKLPALLGTNPDAELVVDPGTAQALRSDEHTRDLAPTVREPGERFSLGGATVEAIGGEHAVIHPDLPTIANNGYLVDDGSTTVLHPGDSFTPPPRAVDVLLLPTGAPWLKASEAIDFLRAVAPPLAVPIHEAVLSRPEVYYRWYSELAGEGTEFRIAPQGRSVSPG